MNLLYSYRKLLLDPITETGGGGTPIEQKAVNKPMLRVDIPKAVPDSIKKSTFDVSEFDVEQLPESAPVQIEDKTGKVTEAKETSAQTEPKTEEKVEAKVEPKVEPKKEPVAILQPPKKDQKDIKGKEKITQITPGTKEKVQRDYTGHSTEEVEAFKKMSDESYQFTKNLLTKNKELSKLEGQSYLQHEMGYVLDPEFQKMRTELHYVNTESNHWKQQLLLMEQGKAVHDIKGFTADGKIVLGAEHQPTADLKIEVQKRMYACDGAAQQANSKLQEYPKKFQEQIKNDRTAIDNEMKSRFSWENDPKLLDYELAIEFEDGTKNVSIKQIREDFLSLLPPYERHSMGSRVAANLMVALRIGHAELAAARAGAGVAATLKEEAAAVEPSSGAGAPKDNKKKVHGVSEFSAEPI